MSKENAVQKDSVSIHPAGGVALKVTARRHTLIVDQPGEEGGDDRGMTPVELFAGSLGACIGYYALRFFQRRQIPTEGLGVSVEWEYAEQPHRIGAILARVDLPGDFPAGMKDRLQKVLEGCTVHNSLTHSPKIQIAFSNGQFSKEARSIT